MDIFFVDKIPFLITLIRKIYFTATIHLPTQKATDIFKYFWRVYFFYLKHGFKITTVHADGKFYPLQEIIVEMSSGPMVNLTSANELVPKIEGRILVVKESCRSTRHSLPFMRLPVILTINILLNNVKLLGYFPTNAGILKIISPRAIMTGENLNYKRHLEIYFGKYC